MPVGPGGALHVGGAPTATHAPFQALLAALPAKDVMRHLSAGLVLQPGARGEPLLLLVLQGRPSITLHGAWACFEKIALWLAHIDASLHGMVGPHKLEYLCLDAVVEPVPVDTSVSQRRWYNVFA